MPGTGLGILHTFHCVLQPPWEVCCYVHFTVLGTLAGLPKVTQPVKNTQHSLPQAGLEDTFGVVRSDDTNSLICREIQPLPLLGGKPSAVLTYNS